jgi:hypothetical protein
MRARRREINIFNMSLLDILCGALGAFCFMMLVAFPYYKPSRSSAQLVEDQEKTRELLRQLEQLKEKMGDPNAAQDLEDLLRRLQAQIQSLQGQVNQLTAENDQLKQKNEELKADNERQERSLAHKKPFLVIALADQNQGVDIFLQDDQIMKGGDKSANAQFDPSKPRNISAWENDLDIFLPSLGMNIWMSASAQANTHFKIYMKLANEPKARKSTDVAAGVYGDLGDNKGALVLPTVTLTPERFWTFVGTLTVDDNNKLIFFASTPEQRDAEWKAIAKTSPPPIVTPTAAPASAAPATPVPSATLSDERRALLEKLRKEQEQSASGGQTSPSQKSAEDQRREMLEKLQKERQERQSPTPGDERRDMIQKRSQDRQSQPSPSPSLTP